MSTVEFWFEFGSTYSYPAAMRVESLALKKRVNLLWRPFLLGPIFKNQGWSDSPFNLFSAKGNYMWRDMQRVCDAEGIPFRKPSLFPRNGLLASRVACNNANEEWMPEFVRKIYLANFVHDLDISSREVVGQCLESLGLSPADVLSAAESAKSKELLKQQTELANQKGIFGAPTITIGDELFWGNDRLESAMDWIGESREDS